MREGITPFAHQCFMTGTCQDEMEVSLLGCHLMHVSTPSSRRTKDTTAAKMCALACARAAVSWVVRPPVRPL